MRLANAIEKLRPRRPTEMQAKVDSKRFGPWALIPGVSSDIGREFARETNSLPRSSYS
jgi:hypothetical protein